MPHHYYEMTHETLALLSGQGNEVGAGGLALCRVPRRARPVSSVTQPLPPPHAPTQPHPGRPRGATGPRNYGRGRGFVGRRAAGVPCTRNEMGFFVLFFTHPHEAFLSPLSPPRKNRTRTDCLLAPRASRIQEQRSCAGYYSQNARNTIRHWLIFGCRY